ncbi:MAG: thioredoxin domain-containing protein [Candidatus Nanopelagicales bacterium]
MTDQTAGSDQPDPNPVIDPAPTTVVGYPDGSAPSVVGQANPGMASLRGAVSTVRILVIACLALLLVLSAGVVLGIASVRGQVDELSAQVAALGSAPAAAVVNPAPEEAAAAQQAPQAPQEEPVDTVLSTAPSLPEGTVIPAGADSGGAILVGDPNAANVVEVYVDYQCPYCQRWEQEIGAPLIDKALTPGSDLLIKQYNLAFLGEANPSLDPPGASARAASAAACVVEGEGADVFIAFNSAIFDSADPAEPASQFSTATMAELARQLGAGDATVVCIEEERHVPFAAVSTQAGFGRGVGGTPTVLFNGQVLENPFADPALSAILATTAG